MIKLVLRFWVLQLLLFFVLALHICNADLRHGYSMLQYGHKLDRRMITSYDKYSILDCVEDCLRTTRCQSINYYQGAHFCQTNFENRTTVPDLYIKRPGWIYSNIEDWDKGIAGACSVSNCALNEKCIPKPFGQYKCALSGLTFFDAKCTNPFLNSYDSEYSNLVDADTCISKYHAGNLRLCIYCGIPSNEGFSLEKIQEWDAIGITRGIHVRCALGYKQQGSGLFVCRSNGSWRTDLNCTLITCPVGYKEMTSHATKTCFRFVDTPTSYPNATLDCKKDDGDLVKLDRESLKDLLFDFIDDNIKKSANKNIWIQAKEDAGGIWRFHDGSTLPNFLKKDMNETNSSGEFYLKYVIDKRQFWDNKANSLYSYICEYRIY